MLVEQWIRIFERPGMRYRIGNPNTGYMRKHVRFA